MVEQLVWLKATVKVHACVEIDYEDLSAIPVNEHITTVVPTVFKGILLKATVEVHACVETDYEALSAIPVNEHITSVVPTIFKGIPRSQAMNGSANDDDEGKAPEQEMGPMQGGATGMPEGEFCNDEECLAQPFKGIQLKR
jgi:hypothetical protein